MDSNWENRLREEEEEVEIFEWRLGEIQKVHMNKNKREAEEHLGAEMDSFRWEWRNICKKSIVEIYKLSFQISPRMCNAHMFMFSYDPFY